MVLSARASQGRARRRRWTKESCPRTPSAGAGARRSPRACKRCAHRRCRCVRSSRALATPNRPRRGGRRWVAGRNVRVITVGGPIEASLAVCAQRAVGAERPLTAGSGVAGAAPTRRARS
eukprot:6913784-Prymnesium_polylepis.3